ncbi:rCG61326 [Rattus norvegicus]|uniref:RCG61326 n=1 Tax=Rattus norvegicus TaxID=10116 RepID=A6HAK2_RAT|nr:rCG61326 [Rattus norvegicus]
MSRDWGHKFSGKETHMHSISTFLLQKGNNKCSQSHEYNDRTVHWLSCIDIRVSEVAWGRRTLVLELLAPL